MLLIMSVENEEGWNTAGTLSALVCDRLQAESANQLTLNDELDRIKIFQSLINDTAFTNGNRCWILPEKS